MKGWKYSDPHPGGNARRRTNGDKMRVRQGIKALVATVFTGGLVASALAVVPAVAGAASTSSAPGVTSNSITVGTISTQTGTLASNFSSLIYGEKAYYQYINAQGGVNGRKIDYKYALDDGGNPTTFNQLANTLINQDHVFAVTGVATAFFSPNLFTESGMPTYGYNVTGNWGGAPNLFAAGGSVQYYPAEGPIVGYVSKQTKSPKIAFVAYGIAASADACQAGASALSSNGFQVVYTDFKVSYPGTTVATDVQRMKQAGANMIVSCMDVQGNITMARAVQQYGLKATQLWFSGNDQATLQQNQSLMQGVYFSIAHVPYTAPTSIYPGLKRVLDPDEEVRAQVRERRDRDPGLGVGCPLRPGRKDGGQQPDPGQRDQGGQLLDGVHRRRLDGPDELEERRPLRPCAAVLQRLHPGQGDQVRAGAEQGEERVRVLPVDQPEQGARLPAPGRHARPRLISRAG